MRKFNKFSWAAPGLFFLSLFPAGCLDSRDNPQAVLESARLKIKEEFTRIDLELGKTAERLKASGLTGPEARSALRDLFAVFPFAIDCTAVDVSGLMITVEPAPYRHLEGSDISGQEQMKRLIGGRAPVLSDVFPTIEGFEATDSEYPILGPDGTLLGSVSLLFSTEKLLADALTPRDGGRVPSIWVMETGGRILFHSDKTRIGANFFGWERLRTDEPLHRLAERIAANPDGEDSALGAAWTSVSLYGTAWRLVAFREY